MADNTVLNLGTGGDSIATDDIGGIKYPRSKVTLGADGVNDGDVSLGNPLPVKNTCGTATLANVASSASNVVIAAANTARRGFMLQNDSTAILYLKYGATASATSHTVKIPPDTHYEMPEPIYTGVLNGIWASANGSARTTELTA